MKLFFTLFIIMYFTIVYSQNVNKDNNISSKTIIFKLKLKNRSVLSQKNIISSKYKTLSKLNITQMFPNKKPLNKGLINKGFVDLSLLYKAELNSNEDYKKVIYQLKKTNLFDYVELKPLDSVLYTPNDPNASSQYYLDNMQVYDAWDIFKGDTSIIIGITDTGIDFAHEDLNGNIYRNYNDPIDGVDNDYDGYVDNFWGWDMGNNDNNPQWNQIPENANPHGVYVSGCASAVADNGVGMAGIGFKTKIMPIKVSANNGNVIVAGYEGIVYAADHGCDIINCSWGGTSYTQFGQDIVNYATINRSALVVAAAGNNGDEIYFYPASYDNVLNVTASNINDNKWHGGNYTVDVDVSAPGENVLMTAPNNSYTPGWGTSFASPMAASAAAMVKGYYDTLSALQVGEIIRLSSDNIDTVPGNSQFAEMMGKGRVNLYRALTDTFGPAIRFKNIVAKNINDTVYLSGDFVNYLKSTDNVNVLLTSESEYITIQNPGMATGHLNTMDTLNNNDNPFVIILNDDIPVDYKVYIKLNYSAQNYSDYQKIRIKINDSYANIDTNNISTTVANNSMIAYTVDREGIGFKYKNSESLSYEIGLVLGVSSDVSFCSVRGHNDFYANTKVQNVSPTDKNCDQELVCNYRLADSSKLNVSIQQKIMAWKSSEYSDFVIVNYNVVNKTDTTINNFALGIFSDWDIFDYSTNKINYDSETKTAYTYSSVNDTIYCGIKLLSDSCVVPYAFDNIQGGAGGVDLTDGFSMEEQYQALTNTRKISGLNSQGNDVCSMLSVSNKQIAPHDTLKLFFVLSASKSLPELLTTSIESQQLYDSLWNNKVYVQPISQNENINIYPNPVKSKLSVELPNDGEYGVVITSLDGKIVMQTQSVINMGIINIDVSTIKPGQYILSVFNETHTLKTKFIKINN